MCPPFPGMQASAVVTHCIAKMLMSSDQYREDLNAPWVTDLVILKFGGLNQWGRTEGVMVFDFSASGTGASCNRDGVDTTAIMMAPGNIIADVESVESKHPLLHLFRKAVADSGGAGKFEGD